MKELRLLAIALVFAVAVVAVSDAARPRERSRLKLNSNKYRYEGDSPLNVFVVPHTHDDVGWIMTPTGYYEESVRSIITSTVAALKANPARRFIYVEQYFFNKWWTDVRTTDQMRQDLRSLVQNGQWEFVIGGWVMHDEATTTYSANIDQMTQGHQFLLETFKNVTPTIGWQIDPFGASSVVASHNILSGFKYHVIDRINYKLKDNLIASKRMEFMWTPSDSLGKSSSIFTHILFDNYCQPQNSGFNFEADPDNNPPITPENVSERAQQFASLILQMAAAYPTNNVLIPMGCDFGFVDADVQFSNLDPLLSYMQNHSKTFNMNIKYSLLSDYFAAVSAVRNVQWPQYSGDFFSYDDNDESWWTGYFTSRTALKGFVRKGEAQLRSTDILLASSKLGSPLSSDEWSELQALRTAMAEVQHHDGVTGTEKDFVATAYWDNIQHGLDVSQPLKLQSISNLIRTNPSAPELNFTNDSSPIYSIVGHAGLPVVVYNSLGFPRTEIVKLPVNTTGILLMDSTGKSVPHQLMPNNDPNDPSHPFVFYFEAKVPPLGFSVYFVGMYCASKSSKASARCQEFREKNSEISIRDDFVPSVSNGLMQVNMSETTGRVSSIQNLQASISIAADQQFLAYESYSGPGQASGAYIFRPVGPAAPVTSQPPQTNVIQGRLVQEIRQQFTPWLSQTIRMFKGLPWVEFQTRMGPIPGNTEIITRISTDIRNQQVLFTDDNGWENQKRAFAAQEKLSIPASHYPTLYSAYITSSDAAPQLSLCSDRSRSASSQANGQIEMMLHRRSLQDDGRGVGEALDDTDVVTPTWRVLLSPQKTAPLDRFITSYSLNYPLEVLFSTSTVPKPTQFTQDYRALYSLLKSDLPQSVHIVSLKYLSGKSGSLVVRFAHVAAANEAWAAPQTIDMNALFQFRVRTVVETTLTANQAAPGGVNSPQFTIYPKQIRTFVITIAA